MTVKVSIWPVLLLVVVAPCAGCWALGATASTIVLVGIIALLVGVIGLLLSCLPRWPR